MHCVKKVTDDLYWIGEVTADWHYSKMVPDSTGSFYNLLCPADENGSVRYRGCIHQRIVFENLEHVLNGRTLDYLIVNHNGNRITARSSQMW